MGEGQEPAKHPVQRRDTVGSGGVLTAAFVRMRKDTPSASPAQPVRTEGGGEILDIEDCHLRRMRSETNTGEADGQERITNVHVTFKAVHAIRARSRAISAGAAEGEIKTKQLKGSNWDTSTKTPPEPKSASVLEPAESKGHFAEFECPGLGLVDRRWRR